VGFQKSDATNTKKDLLNTGYERPRYAGSSCKYLGTIEGLFCCYFVLREKNITDFSVTVGYVFF
jgi:hypothetical protein